ncbi:hypothetical protein [Nocardia sputorum]|uniref:hypothetical protein n=1 Tax=Nocardia sputorum TaxID=2984338 RepID=UPI00248F877F|nr:hypothetical protein [Nocardia sputorum]
MSEIVDTDPWVWVCGGCGREFISGWDDELEDATDEPSATYPGEGLDPVHYCEDCCGARGSS